MRYLILFLFISQAYALLPPSEKELNLLLTDPNEVKRIETQLVSGNACGWFKNIEETEDFKRAKKILNEHANAVDDLELSKKNHKPGTDPETQRRKEALDEEIELLKQASCNHPERFRKVIRVYQDIDKVIEALISQDPQIKRFELAFILEESRDLVAAHDHYHDYKSSINKYTNLSLQKAERNLRFIENDPLFKELKEKYSQEELERIRTSPELKMPRQIVINFEGTGGYSPKTARRIKALNSYLGVNKTDEQKEKIKDRIWQLHDDKNLGMTTWPGIIHGTISEPITALNKESKGKGHPNTQWMYFQSEDQEESRKTAADCLENYLQNFDEQYGKGLRPSVVVIGHSSGGFSAMKFANELKAQQPKLSVKLVTIDPVVPYKRAALIGLRRRLNPLEKNRIGDTLDSGETFRVDPGVEAYNFYQKQDVHGLLPTEDAGGYLKQNGVGLGIHGSKVDGAKNEYIKYTNGTFDARKAHGAISYHPDVLEKIEELLK